MLNFPVLCTSCKLNYFPALCMIDCMLNFFPALYIDCKLGFSSLGNDCAFVQVARFNSNHNLQNINQPKLVARQHII